MQKTHMDMERVSSCERHGVQACGGLKNVKWASDTWTDPLCFKITSTNHNVANVVSNIYIIYHHLLPLILKMIDMIFDFMYNQKPIYLPISWNICVLYSY